jgi:hypothetical protein
VVVTGTQQNVLNKRPPQNYPKRFDEIECRPNIGIMLVLQRGIDDVMNKSLKLAAVWHKKRKNRIR